MKNKYCRYCELKTYTEVEVEMKGMENHEKYDNTASSTRNGKLHYVHTTFAFLGYVFFELLLKA